MTREEARKIVEKVAYPHANCLICDARDVRVILGQELFSKLAQDINRRNGPTKSTIYSWNVIHYLMQLS